MPNAARNIALAALFLGGAYGAYRYVYIPHKVKQDMMLQAQLLAQQRGISQGDAFALLGQGACAVIGAKYGLPPQASFPMCAQAGQLLSSLVGAVPGILTGGGNIANTGINVVGGVGGTVLSTSTSLVGGATKLVGAVASAPVKIVGEIFGSIKNIFD